MNQLFLRKITAVNLAAVFYMLDNDCDLLIRNITMV